MLQHVDNVTGRACPTCLETMQMRECLAICDRGARLAMTELSFMSFAGLMQRQSWLVQRYHGSLSTGIYYSEHNYAVGRFVSQSIRAQLFIRLPVIALCWRRASHTHLHMHRHIFAHKQTQRHLCAPTNPSPNISL